MSFFKKDKKVPEGSLILVSVVDTVAEKFGALVQIDNEKAAIRAFRDMVRDKRSVIGQHPADFQLVRIGYFNPSTGDIYSAQKDGKPEVILSGFEADGLNQFEGVPTIEREVKNEVHNEIQPSEK